MREKCWRFLEGRNGEIGRDVCPDVTVDVASTVAVLSGMGESVRDSRGPRFVSVFTHSSLAVSICPSIIHSIFYFIVCLRAGKEDFCISSFQFQMVKPLVLRTVVIVASLQADKMQLPYCPSLLPWAIGHSGMGSKSL
jgi:hypothetical protein